MARAQFISRQDIVSRTKIGGVTDEDKFTENIQYAQDIKLRALIGKDLLDKLKTDVVASTLTGDYLALVQNQIKDYLVYSVAADYIRFSFSDVNNGGLNNYDPDNGTAQGNTQAIDLATNTENKAEAYGQLLIEFLDDNKTLFPEYKKTGSDSNYHNWNFLSDAKGTC
jgi:hypothetical protein